MSPGPPRINVAILAVPEVTAFATYAMYDLFAGAGRDWAFITTGVAAPSRMRPYIVAAQPEPVISANGISIKPDYVLDACPEPSIVCIPDFSLLPGASCAGSFDVEVDWLRRCHAAGATLASVCTSTSLLAATGLLDGLDATIHWAYATTLKRHHPTVRVHPNRALVVTGVGQRIVMAGGGTSHLDLVLYLIGRFVGLKEALEVSKAYLINWHDAGQQPFASLHGSQRSSDGLIAKCQAWVAEHYADPSPVGAMTKLSGLSERTFIRRFVKATGLSPLEYVHALRLEEAKQILETEELSVEAVAEQVGYEDTSFFGRLFRRKVGLTPAQYRLRFGSLRRALHSFTEPATPTMAAGPVRQRLLRIP
jgi:transcriptional regulator GlxA family with amidase domain